MRTCINHKLATISSASQRLMKKSSLMLGFNHSCVNCRVFTNHEDRRTDHLRLSNTGADSDECNSCGQCNHIRDRTEKLQRDDVKLFEQTFYCIVYYKLSPFATRKPTFKSYEDYTSGSTNHYTHVLI
jgi:hypothetical protein